MALGLTLLAAPAFAQDAPLTTLMRPQPLAGQTRLGGGDPLARPDRLSGERSLSNTDALAGEDSLSGQRVASGGKPGETVACDARASGAARTGRQAGIAVGGSGPGEYGRFVETERPAPSKRTAAAAPAYYPGTADRPLVGGTDRPLWGDPSARGAAKPGPARAAATGAGAGAIGAPATAPAATASVDRPLWETEAAGRPGGAEPCSTAAAPPTQTLFFNTGPAR